MNRKLFTVQASKPAGHAGQATLQACNAGNPLGMHYMKSFRHAVYVIFQACSASNLSGMQRMQSFKHVVQAILQEGST
jgi:hypothetical protein